MTYCDSKMHRASGSGQGKLGVIMLVGFFSHLSNAVDFGLQVRMVLKPLVSLIGCLVACSERIAADKHT